MTTVAPFDLQLDGIDSEACFRHVFACSPIGIALVAPDGRWLRVNRALCAVVGYTEAELLATTFQAITHPEDLQSDLVLLVQTMNGERDGYAMEKRYFHKDGRIIWILLDVRLIRKVDTGHPLYFISQVQDITGRKQAEAARQAAREEAEQANAAKTEFLSRISHELRTPLNAILGFGQLLEGDKHLLTDMQAEGVGHILTAGRELLALVNQVLKVSQTQESHNKVRLESIAVGEIMQTALAGVRSVATQHGLQIALEEADPALCVLADREKLKEILAQLLINAVRYNRAAGSVILRCQTSGQSVFLDVVDTGIGIPAAGTEKIFWPFYRADEVQHIDGVGLGLYLASVMVKMLGGKLTVRSEVGQGSTFSVELPRSDQPMEGPPLDPLVEQLARADMFT